MICGNCKNDHSTASEVKACYADARGGQLTITKPLDGFSKQYVESRDFKPMALSVPDSHYALESPDGILFYEVRTGKSEKWNGVQFVDRLIGAPGQWRRLPIKGKNKYDMLELIGAQAKEAAIRYSREFTVCAVCGSPLSDPESIAMGLGPICAKRF